MSWESVTSVQIPNGESLAYRQSAGEIPVLLLHGNLASSVHWDVVVEAMDDRFELYGLDLRGFGESSYNGDFDSLKALADDVVQFTEAIGLDAYHLWGWSGGAGVAIQVAADVPHAVDRLVLMAPPSTQGLPVYRRDETGARTDEVLTTREELASEPVTVAPVLQALEDEDREAMRRIWEEVIYVHDRPDDQRFEAYVAESLETRCYLDLTYALVHFNVSREDNGIEPGTGEVDRIESPTLVLRGTDDPVIPEPLVERVVRDVETAEYVELPDCGHAPMIDDLAGLLDRVEPFLADA